MQGILVLVLHDPGWDVVFAKPFFEAFPAYDFFGWLHFLGVVVPPDGSGSFEVMGSKGGLCLARHSGRFLTFSPLSLTSRLPRVSLLLVRRWVVRPAGSETT